MPAVLPARRRPAEQHLGARPLAFPPGPYTKERWVIFQTHGFLPSSTTSPRTRLSEPSSFFTSFGLLVAVPESAALFWKAAPCPDPKGGLIRRGKPAPRCLPHLACFLYFFPPFPSLDCISLLFSSFFSRLASANCPVTLRP